MPDSVGPLARFLADHAPRRSSGPALRLVHVTPLSRFRSIWGDDRLSPRPCRVMGTDLVYCSYGDIVLRPSGEQQGWCGDPPVALVLNPAILAGRYTFAPVDTGALAAGRVAWLPDAARTRMRWRYGVQDQGGRRLGQWIALAFGDERGYERREQAATETVDEPEEALMLRRLCGTAAHPASTAQGEDYRVMSHIECQFERPINVRANLEAICLPLEAGVLALSVRQQTGASIHFHCDQPERGNLPADLVAHVRRSLRREALLG